MIVIAEYMKIRGAKEHNLKEIDILIPKNKMTVITGLSGSGKSSLAFDTIYADGQRRYLESLSSYARQFIGQLKKPSVNSIEGISPTISISQKSTSHNPRSTVGTVTEIYDYLRLLYARIGIPHCPQCKGEVKKQSIDQIVDSILNLEKGTRIYLMAPLVRGRKGQHLGVFDQAKKKGYIRVMVDGNIYRLDQEIKLDKNKKHDIDLIVDRLVIDSAIRTRLSDSIEDVFSLSGGILKLYILEGETLLYSEDLACPNCYISIDDIEPRSFSFNSPFGACPTCTGLGYKMEFDVDLMIPDKSLSIDEGAIVAYGWQSSKKKGSFTRAILDALAEEFDFRLDLPFDSYPKKIQDIIIKGTDKTVKVYYSGQWGGDVHDIRFAGLIKNVEKHYNETSNAEIRAEYEKFMRFIPCASCHGQRLKKESLSVTIGKTNIADLTDMSIKECDRFFENLRLNRQEEAIAKQLLKEIRLRLRFLVDVGLDYLTLSRAANTLSGGEMQRIRLATQIGSGLVGVDYILDEPSIGLHQRDNNRLIKALHKMRDLGNTVIVVEHDEETIRSADHIIDIGPGAGVLGGEVIVAGTVEDIIRDPRSITGAYLSGSKSIPIPSQRRKTDKYLTIYGARANNLKNIDVTFNLGVFNCVTGVSGSGKSSLVNETLYKVLTTKLNRKALLAGKHKRVEGIEQLDKVIDIDQSPIGRTPRSNPATYIGVFDLIRSLYASTTSAKIKGYKKGRFSFNVKGGRCEACSGNGIVKVEMHFMPDVYVACDVCEGKRYNRETLEVKYKGKSIYDVLEMTVEEALDFFENIPSIQRKIQTLYDVGLSYIKLGQSSTTLSGGEAQRIKLAAELSKRATGKTIYILDEPTTGLHFDDVDKLLSVLHRIVDEGNTVVVIEHNLDVIKTADHIIDLGPEGGDEGGRLVATGTPEQISACSDSYTGIYLKRILEANKESKK
ncbi:MAG: excinuclease ABC subunit UvrA [Clostridiales bacterium]|jgi:excinuclease ABC subunit A|nr:excinuclease ABC subunit UvrA [Clostridia bacterium]NLH59169.1 excinuclease ABC subunit UvrA [Clostridiales bacterium]